VGKTFSNADGFFVENLMLRQESVKKLRGFFIYLLIILIFFSGIFFMAWQEIVKNKKLKLEISALSSLSRVEREAVENLKLKVPTFEQVRIIEKKQSKPR